MPMNRKLCQQSEKCGRFDRKRLKLFLLMVIVILTIISFFINTASHSEKGDSTFIRPRNNVEKCESDSLVVGIKINALNKRFLNLGGTRHWFHLLERLISQIDTFKSFHENVVKLKVRNSSILYITFDKINDVENLGPFGRLLFSSLAGGRDKSHPNFFDTVIFGHSISKRLIRMEKDDNDIDLYAIEEHYFESQFVVDLKSQTAKDLFVVSANKFKKYSKKKYVCLQMISKISLDKVNTKFEWFDGSIDRFDIFRSWIFNTCDSIINDANKQNNDEKNMMETNKLLIDDKMYEMYRNKTEISSKLSNKKNEEIVINEFKILNNLNKRKKKNSFSEFMSTSLLKSYNASTITSDDLNVGNGEMQRKIKKAFWKNKMKDSDIVLSPILYYSTYNQFLSNLSLSSSSSSSSSFPISSAPSSSSSSSRSSNFLISSPLKVLIYQRDYSRRIINIIETKSIIKSSLGSEWIVEIITHNEILSPCIMIQNVRTATVLITSHGFQSILLLFQPCSSLLIEIHPSYYLKQEVYGFIQAGLRQNFNLARSYLAEESVPTTFLSKKIKIILEKFHFLTHDCLHGRICRNLARRQDVKFSIDFMKRSTDFILSHFVT